MNLDLSGRGSTAVPSLESRNISTGELTWRGAARTVTTHRQARRESTGSTAQTPRSWSGMRSRRMFKPNILGTSSKKVEPLAKKSTLWRADVRSIKRQPGKISTLLRDHTNPQLYPLDITHSLFKIVITSVSVLTPWKISRILTSGNIEQIEHWIV